MGEQEWICIVCFKEITKKQMPDAVQIELDVEGAGKGYTMRHGSCEMNHEARLRLARIGQGARRDQADG